MKRILLLVAVVILGQTAYGQSTAPPANVKATTPPAATSASPAASPLPTNKAPGTNSAGPATIAKGSVVVPPEKSNPITVPRFDKAPVIDGKLDEAIWQTAAVLKNFYQIQPGDNTQPSKETEVFLGYDARFLYIAFRCYD